MCEISLIIPIYNSEKYLVKCIESAVHQTFQSYEVILVDDGSTDSSGSICDDYAKKLSNVKVIHNINMGVATARKCGIMNSVWNYIMFVDSDDWIEPNTLEIMYKKVKEYKCDIVACEYFRDSSLGSVKSRFAYKKDKKYENKEEIFADMLSYTCIYVWLVNKIFNRNLFDEIDFYEGVKLGEDCGVCLQLLDKAKFLVAIKDNLYHYRQNENSVCYTNAGHKADESAIANVYSEKYPSYKKYFLSKYYIERIGELVLNCRKQQINKEFCKYVSKELHGNMKYILKNRKVAIKYKVSFIFIYVAPVMYCRLFIFMMNFFNL